MNSQTANLVGKIGFNKKPRQIIRESILVPIKVQADNSNLFPNSHGTDDRTDVEALNRSLDLNVISYTDLATNPAPNEQDDCTNEDP